MERILGLDLSLTGTGWATSVATNGTWEPPKTSSRGCERLDWILQRLLDLVQDSQGKRIIDLVVLEGYSFGSSAAGVRAIGELGGLIRWALWKKRIPYAEVPPKSLKLYATGKGNAGKPEMLVAAMKRLGFEGHDDNQVDAVWLRQMGLDAYGRSRVDLPAVNRAALAKVAWPGLAPLPPKPKKRRKGALA